MNEKFQVGTLDEPATLIYGLSQIDAEKSCRGVKVSLTPEQEEVFLQYDKEQQQTASNVPYCPLIKEAKGTKALRLKVSVPYTKVYNNKGFEVSLNELKSGRRVVFKCKARPFNCESRGISILATAIKIVDDTTVDTNEWN